MLCFGEVGTRSISAWLPLFFLNTDSNPSFTSFQTHKHIHNAAQKHHIEKDLGCGHWQQSALESAVGDCCQKGWYSFGQHQNHAKGVWSFCSFSVYSALHEIWTVIHKSKHHISRRMLTSSEWSNKDDSGTWGHTCLLRTVERNQGCSVWRKEDHREISVLRYIKESHMEDGHCYRNKGTIKMTTNYSYLKFYLNIKKNCW